MSTVRHRAVVDCGSNSTRLWLAGRDGDPPTRREVITRLGRGVDATGRLDDDRLAHCLEVVADYAARWREAGIGDDEVVVVATSAVRDATDRARFFAGVRKVAGVEARVLSGEEEATMSFLGATGALDLARPTLVVDIGGGSTELVVGHDDGMAATSLQLGTVRLTERHLASDPPTADQVGAARRDAQDTLRGGLSAVGLAVPSAEPPVRSVVAVAGTAMSLARLDVGAGPDLHGHVLTATTLDALAMDLLARSAQARLAMGPLDPGRADVVAAGALILATLVDLVGIESVVASEADNLDGVASGALD